MAPSYRAAPSGFPRTVFLSFEGIDGSGKTTQARRIADHLEARGCEVVRVREPGGTPLGESIRSLLLQPDVEITPRAELLLFSAARAQLVETVIVPALARGAIVVADRFFDSTTAYQGGGRGVLDIESAEAFHSFVTSGLAPHRTVIVDVDVETSLRRRAGQIPDRLEAVGVDFQHRVREAYRALAAHAPERIVVVDGSAEEAVVTQEILRRLGLES